MGDIPNDADQDVRVICEKDDDPNTYRELMYTLDSSSKRRLLVDAILSANVKLTRYGLKVKYTDSDQTISDSATASIYKASDESITSGQVEGFAIYTDDDDYEVIIEIDGEECMRIDPELLYDSWLSRTSADMEAPPFAIYTQDQGCHFIFWPRTPIDFTTEFEVKIKNLNSYSMKVTSKLFYIRKELS